jgi:hypothetical protein
MQTDAERTLHNLHVLSVLSHNDKLMTNDDTFDIYAPTTFRGMFRMWYGEKRACNLQRVRCTIRSAIAFASSSLNDANALVDVSNEHEHMRLRTDTAVMEHVRMCDGIECAKLGLHNLMRTYRDDAALVSQLQLLISEIEHFLVIMQPHTHTLLLKHHINNPNVHLRFPSRASQSDQQVDRIVSSAAPSASTDLTSPLRLMLTLDHRTLPSPLHPNPLDPYPSNLH